MDKLFIEQLRLIVGQIDSLAKVHPKADIFYNVKERGVQVVYPLPKDFYELKGFKIELDN